MLLRRFRYSTIPLSHLLSVPPFLSLMSLSLPPLLPLFLLRLILLRFLLPFFLLLFLLPLLFLLLLPPGDTASPTAPQPTTRMRTLRAELGPGVRYQLGRRCCVIQRGKRERDKMACDPCAYHARRDVHNKQEGQAPLAYESRIAVLESQCPFPRTLHLARSQCNEFAPRGRTPWRRQRFGCPLGLRPTWISVRGWCLSCLLLVLGRALLLLRFACLPFHRPPTLPEQQKNLYVGDAKVFPSW